jgi:hypothetical protein
MADIGKEERRALAGLLRSLADYIETATAQEIAELVDRKSRIQIGRAEPIRAKKPRRLSSSKDYWKIVNRLRELPTRDQGQQLLDSYGFTKTELEELARSMDLPVIREDTHESLRRKIIESSIGSRLASQAIRGE